MMAGLSCEGLIDTAAEWMKDGACRGTDPNLFHIDAGESPREPLAWCKRCNVTEECLAYAVTNGISYGIWGGMTPRKRRLLAARRPRESIFLSQSARERIVWLAKTGWRHHEIAREFNVTQRTIERVLARERAS